MSDTSATQPRFLERIAGKWQIPALAGSIILLIAVAVQVRSPDRKIPIKDHLEYLVRLIDQGMFLTAQEHCEKLLEWPDVQDQTRGILNIFLARATYGRAAQLFDDTDATRRKVVQLYKKADDLHATFTENDHRQLARCYERLGQYDAAVSHYGEAARLAPGPALAERKRLIELSEYPLGVGAETIAGYLDDYIADARESLPDLAWALERRVEMLAAAGKRQASQALLDQYRAQFEGSDYEIEYAYIDALSLWSLGQYDEAERRLRELMNRITISDHVYPKAGWLLGRVVMFDGQAQRPEEAVAIFRDVISTQADRYYTTASWVGMAEALAYLRRYDDSLNAYRTALDDIGSTIGHRLVNPDVVRASLTAASDRLRQVGQGAFAVDYLRMATSLVPGEKTEMLARYLERLGSLQSAVAHEYLAQAQGTDFELRDKGTRLLAEAGSNLFRLASLATLNERISAAAMWRAAGLFEEAGDRAQAINVLRAYLVEHPNAEVIPRLRLRLGRALQMAGQFADAVEVLQRNYSEFPRSVHANASLIPLAECLMAMGGDREQAAEKALLQIVQDSDIYTPEAPEYRDAMFLLGKLYTRREEFERVIPWLSEFVENYPEEPRAASAMFLVADAYRQSAMAIKEELVQPEFVGEAKRLKVERVRRLSEAARRFSVYRELMAKRDPSTFSALEQTYVQDAMLDEAACYFELGRYDDALALYEKAAWIFKDRSASLGAYVQAINCHVFLGNTQEARAVLRRAQYQVETIPDEAFAATADLETREDWRRYFDWVGNILNAGTNGTAQTGSMS